MAHPSSWSMALRRALALHQAGRLKEAGEAYRLLLAGEPKNFDALHFFGVLRAQGGDFEGSVALLRQAIAVDGAVALAHFHLAESLRLLERYAEALKHYDRAAALDPAFRESALARARCLAEAERWDEALAACGTLPSGAERNLLKGKALLGLKRFAEALASFDAAPVDADVRLGRSVALDGLGRPEEALAEADRALALQPRSAEIHSHRAGLLIELGRTDEGLAAFEQALACNPAFVPAYYNLGGALLDLGRFEAAIHAYDGALAVKPGHVPSLYNRSLALEYAGRKDEALASCDKALALDPDFGAAAAKSFLMRAMVCDWTGRQECLAELKRLAAKHVYLDLFTLLGAFDEPQLHLEAARSRAGLTAVPWQGPAVPHRRLRIAYLSPNFHFHPVAHQAVEMFERHDRTRFETFGICLMPGEESPIRRRLKAAFEHFLEAGTLSDYRLAELMRRHEIDIAVDLAGYTNNGRTKALALRPAPLAVNYLGYPGTLGADYVDYIVADSVIVPEEAEGFYAEKVVRLPGCTMPCDTTAGEAPPVTRAEAGLPPAGVVFCAFNNTHKITPEIFGVWMRLLTEVEGSILWLNTQNGTAQANLGREAAARNVSAERLVFTPRVEERARHLARLRLADMFLDTPVYGAHSTANDMLWMGVPVVTCRGRSFASRVAASELAAIGVPELVTDDLAAYEAMALELARSPERRAALRRKLAANRATHPLFDIAGHTRALEAAYLTMWKIFSQGGQPRSFSVKIED